MRIYLDTSVVNAFLFGETKEKIRYLHSSKMFEFIELGKITGIISFYTLHEVYWFCLDNFPQNKAKEKARIALLSLLKRKLEIVPLLYRKDKIYYKNRFPIRDSSDQVHAISAFINKCDVLSAYDNHYKDISNIIRYLQSEELLEIL